MRGHFALTVVFLILFMTFFIVFMDIALKDPKQRLVPIESSDAVETFQMVSNRNDILLFSAYFEEKYHHIRVIGIGASTLIPQNLFCLLKYHNKSWIDVSARYQKISDNFERRYTAVFIFCLLKSAQDVPDAVTIFGNANFKKSSNELKVKIIPLDSTERNFTVCVSPLHTPFNETERLLEWLQINTILGVEKIFVYVHSCSPEVAKILESFQSKRFVKIINWPLPDYLCIPDAKADNLLHYCGQIAALNDCLYRTKGYSTYIAALDTDEFIIPKMEEDRTWPDMIQRLPESDVFIFRHAFFYGEFPVSNKLITQTFFSRQKFPDVPYERSKYIAVTNSVMIAGVHYPKEILGTEYTVNTHVGLLHHYRQQTTVNYRLKPLQIYSTDHVLDDDMKKYADRLQIKR